MQRAAQILAGYTLGQADLLRRAMGKKKKEILDKEFVPFHEGCKERGYSDKAIQAVWDVLVPFAGYAFNKAHSAAYGLVSYWTAYLKANYPAEYMAAVLTSVGDDKDKSALYLSESRRMGVKVLPPDVNASRRHLHRRRRGRPLRPGRDPQRRRERGRGDRRDPQVQGRVHQLRRLPAQGPRGRLQQAGHRVPGQGGRVRLLRPPAQGPVAHPRAGRRLGHRPQAQRGDRPGRPLRRRRGGRGRVRGRDPRRRVGQEDPAQLRAGDARPVRLRPPAARHRAHHRERTPTSRSPS